MAQVLVEESVLQKVLREQQSLRRMVAKLLERPAATQSKWVRIATLMRETGLTREQVRYARTEENSRKKNNGHYEYNLEEFKKIV